MNILSIWKNLPSFFDPTVFSFGSFFISWYSIMYLLAFLVIFLLLFFRLRRNENNFPFSVELLFDSMVVCFFGILVGGRLGHVIFEYKFYLENPLLIISPYDFSNYVWVGISGMSFHGGLIGALIFVWFFAKKKGINFFSLTDFVIPAVPAGYFFGRMGNFINGELLGKKTDFFLGMKFRDEIVRHPTQLYEAFAEGIILFIILWSLRNNKFFKSKLLFVYFIVYGMFRVGIDFLREVDNFHWGLNGILKYPQFFSSLMIAVGIIGLFLRNKAKGAKIIG